MRCCLLHQKLQMLNCCIHHKLSHQQKLKTPNSKTHSSAKNQSCSQSSPSHSHSDFHTPLSTLPAQQSDEGNGSSSDDEFYEALEDVNQTVESENGNEICEMEISKSEDLPSAEDCPTDNDGGGDCVPHEEGDREGVLKQCGDLVLVNTGLPLCIPVTQVGGVVGVASFTGTCIMHDYNISTLHH